VKVVFDVETVQVLTNCRGTDEIIITLDEASPFPSLGYAPVLKMSVVSGQGEQYCRNILGLDDIEVIEMYPKEDTGT